VAFQQAHCIKGRSGTWLHYHSTKLDAWKLTASTMILGIGNLKPLPNFAAVL
jgi:hypothetical protein